MSVRNSTQLWLVWLNFLFSFCLVLGSEGKDVDVCEKVSTYSSNATTRVKDLVITLKSNEVPCNSTRQLATFSVPDLNDTSATFVATFCLRRPRHELIATLLGGYFHPPSSYYGVTSCLSTNDTFHRPPSTEPRTNSSHRQSYRARHKQKRDTKALLRKYRLPVVVTSKSFRISVLLIKKKNGVTTIESRNYTASKSDISSDNTVASEYHKNVPNSVAFFKVPLPGGKLSDCGVKRSCVRIGSIDCGPTNCIYYLTYKTFDRMTMLELEMSGKTWGWIAVGFSSDDKMGADDVIACARTNIRKNDVVVKSLWNREYVTPVVKESHYNVTYTKYENGRVSCKLTLPLESSGPKNLDLTNDWFQLYAMGNITSSGTMTKHDVAYASEQKITVIQKKDFLIISAGTTTSLVKIHLCLLFWSHRLIA